MLLYDDWQLNVMIGSNKNVQCNTHLNITIKLHISWKVIVFPDKRLNFNNKTQNSLTIRKVVDWVDLFFLNQMCRFIAIVFCYWWKRMFNQNQFNLNVGMYEKALLQFSYWQAFEIKIKCNKYNIILRINQFSKFTRKRRAYILDCSITLYSWLSISFFLFKYNPIYRCV